MCYSSMGRSVGSTQKFSTDFRECRRTSPLKKSKKTVADWLRCLRSSGLSVIILHPTDCQFLSASCVSLRGQGSRILSWIHCWLGSKAGHSNYLNQVKANPPTKKENNKSILSVICLGFRSAFVWRPSTHNTCRDRHPQNTAACKSSNIQFYDLASAMISFGTSTLISPYRCGSAC